MKCLHPITLDMSKKGIVHFTGYKFKNGTTLVKQEVVVPCGQCIACRLNYGKFWSMRMMEELKHHDRACFATLTYDPEHYPGKLVKKDLQDFWKRLRKERKVRYFCCGEHGDRFGRAHYHAIIYGVSPEEVDLVAKHWQQGQVKLGTVTPDSCAYVAKYMTKKLRGVALAEQLEIDPDYQNEFVLMSRRPGIGGEPSPAMVKFMKENGFLYRKDKRSGIPRYYRNKYDISYDDSGCIDFEEFQKHLTNFDRNDRVIRKRLDFFGRRS